jgi:hypothetical protein
MKTALARALLAAGALAALPAAAQDYLPLATGGYGPYGVYEEPPIPPRPVPGYGARETIVTTTRRVIAAPAYGVYGEPGTVVTTRRVVGPPPVVGEVDEDFVTGSLRPVEYPLGAPRRVLKSGPDFGPALVARERVVTRRVAEPVILEERRVVATRRILGPAPLEWDD